MEIRRQAYPQRAVALHVSLALALDHCAQRGEVGRGRFLRDFLHRQLLQRLPQLEHVLRFLAGRAGDEGAAIRFQVDQAVGIQLDQHFAHVVARQAVDLRQRLLGQLGAGREAVLHDRVVDFVIHAVLGIESRRVVHFLRRRGNARQFRACGHDCPVHAEGSAAICLLMENGHIAFLIDEDAKRS